MVFQDIPWYSNLFQGIARCSKVFSCVPWCGHWLSWFLCDIPLYFMVFHGVPSPLRALIELMFIWYPMIFHSIPWCSKALAGTDWVDFYVIFHYNPLYSMVFPGPRGRGLGWGAGICQVGGLSQSATNRAIWALGGPRAALISSAIRRSWDGTGLGRWALIESNF